MQTGRRDIEFDRLLGAEPGELERLEVMLLAEFARNPGLAELLLPALASGVPTRIANARTLLCLFNEEALLTIARGIDIDDATARFEILGVLWTLIVAAPKRERDLLVASIAPYLKPGFDDRRHPQRGFADPERMELEHDYRICDETYLLLNRLWSPDFDDSLFETLDEDQRTAVVGQFARRADNLFAAPNVKARKNAGKPAALAELTIVADFPDVYADPETQAERDQALIKKWAPTRRDFLAVARVDTPQAGRAIFEASSFLAALSVIMFIDPSKPDSSAFRPAQSIKRVNIISHGSPGLIGMSGTVDTQGGVRITTRGPDDAPLSGPIDVFAVQAAANPDLLLANGKGLTVSLRDRFAPDAEIYLLACRTGLGGAVLLMQELKNLFRVKIHGFTKEIAFCPRLDAARIIDRTYTAVGDCDSGSKRGFRHLVPDKTY